MLQESLQLRIGRVIFDKTFGGCCICRDPATTAYMAGGDKVLAFSFPGSKSKVNEGNVVVTVHKVSCVWDGFSLRGWVSILFVLPMLVVVFLACWSSQAVLVDKEGAQALC